MSICHTSYNSRCFSPNDNLEPFCLFWLDAVVNTTSENIAAQSKLRSIINYLKTFDNIQTCNEQIRSLSADDQLVLIVSGSLGQEFVPHIVYLPQISSIYVYCRDKKHNKEWADQFSKIRLVTTNLGEVINKIKSDYKIQNRRYVESLVFSISDRSTAAIDGAFLHSQLLIDVLMRIESSRSDIDQLFCRVAPLYCGNDKELGNLKEFRQDYRSDKAALWYTKNTCIYRLLNKALRVQNPCVLLVFRFFIRDLRQQLAQYQCSSPVQVYRGQMMSHDELKVLKISIGKLISMNSFLSTSTNRQVTLNFLKPVDNLERVLFVIDAQPHQVENRPFANICHLSEFKNEDEVLFMLGSIFRINAVQHQNDGVWVIQLTLCSDNDNDLKGLFEYMNKEHYRKNVTLLSFADVVRQMGKFDDAETFYRWYLEELPQGHPNIANCYHGLGHVARDKGDYELSLGLFDKALRLFERTHNRTMIADTYHSIGLVYYHKGDYMQAIDLYGKALEIYKQKYGEDHRHIATCLDGFGAVYGKMEKYSDALYYKGKALVIWQKHLPPDHPDLGQSHTCIGNTNVCLGRLDDAMNHFNQSLAIYQKSLPQAHPRAAMTLKNMGIVYEKKGDFHKALSYYNEVAAIYHHLMLPANHIDVLDIEAKIKNLSK